MAKYNGSIELISGITQKNGGNFPLLDASAIQVDETGQRLNEIIDDIKNGSAITQIDYANVTSKPQINGIELTGNKTIVELGIIDNTLAVENKAADAKITGDKIKVLEGKAHTHTNKTAIDKITDAKINEWTAKETTEGAQQKATQALTEAKAYSDQKITDLVGSAPETLDTIHEIAAALQENQGVVGTLTSQIAGKADKTHQHALSDITGFSVIDNLKSDSQTDALSAKQGKVLKASIDAIHTHTNKTELDKIVEGKVEAWDAKADANHTHTLSNITDMFSVENVLTSESATNALSALQGKTLNDKITVLEADKHKHDNIGELNKITAGKTQAWDNKAEANHRHNKTDIQDLFSVIDGLTSDSTTDALSAKQGKELDIRVKAAEANLAQVHTHTNKDELDKVTAGKVAEWDAKETTTGAQEKVDAGVEQAKAYTNERVNSIVANPSKRVTVSEFSLDESTQLYKATVKHDLNTEHVLVDAFNTTTKENELVSFKIIDANNIEICAEDQDSLEIFVIGEGTKIVTLQQGSIVDTSSSVESTYSSQKIETELNALKERLNALEARQ